MQMLRYLNNSTQHVFCCDITTLATSICSPKNLGLAVHLHNDFGSRTLITSAALYVNSEQLTTASGAIVPPEIPPSGKQCVSATDHWGHNEHRI